ncbi:MAG: hypothetical protein IJM76_03090 [Lachnospiraceae bacterium]|nr:hypothetical protein [Lachnospiraceae bacterium]
MAAGLIVASAPKAAAEEFPEEGEILETTVENTLAASADETADLAEDSDTVALGDDFTAPEDAGHHVPLKRCWIFDDTEEEEGEDRKTGKTINRAGKP